MDPCYEPPNPGSSIRQTHADRPERPDHHLTDIGLDRSRIVPTVEEIIETGGQPA